jgi:hypothetical protein
MGKSHLLGAAVCGAVGAVGGFLLGLLMAVIIDSPAAEAVERKRLEAELHRATTEAEESRSRAILAEEAAAGTLIDLTTESTARDAPATTTALERFQQQGEEAMEYWFSSQAVLGLLIEHPEARPFIFSPTFTENYKAKWYFPKLAFEWFGARWLMEDMIAQGILDKNFLEFADAQTKRLAGSNASKWTVLKRWTTWNDKTTESFRVTSPIWRIRWTSDAEWGVVLSVFRDDGSNDGEGEYIPGAGGGMGNDSSFVRTIPGIFYLDIRPSGGELAAFAPTITVEVPAE